MILTLRRHCVDTVQTLIDTDRNCTDLLIDTDAIGQDIELNSSLKTRDLPFFLLRLVSFVTDSPQRRISVILIPD